MSFNDKNTFKKIIKLEQKTKNYKKLKSENKIKKSKNSKKELNI
jgi:hypothetical protein